LRFWGGGEGNSETELIYGGDEESGGDKES